MNAMNPRKKIKMVWGVRNCEACVEAPTVRPRRMVTMSVRALLAVLARRVVTPHSRNRLPKKRQARGHYEACEKHAHYGEYNLLVLADSTCRFHAYHAFLFSGKQSHDRRLYHGYESHVGIGRHGNCSHKIRSKLRRKEDGRGAVGTADNGDSACLVWCEAQQKCHHICTKNTELCGRSDEHQLRIGDEGRKIGHGADAEEDERRIPAGRHAVVENVEHRAFLVNAHFKTGGGVERDIADENAEANRHQEHGFEILLDSKPYEEKTYGKHHEVAELSVGETSQFPELTQVVKQKIAE